MFEEDFAHQVALEAKQGLEEHDLEELHTAIVVAAKTGKTVATVKTTRPFTGGIERHLRHYGILMEDLGDDENGATEFRFDFSRLDV